MPARFGEGVYSYLEPSLADRWAVSTTSSPYRAMLACDVNLLPPQMKPSRSSGVLQSVSHLCTIPHVQVSRRHYKSIARGWTLGFCVRG